MSSISPTSPALRAFDDIPWAPGAPPSPPDASNPLKPGQMPYTANMPVQQKYDIYAGYVNQFGDQRAKDDLAAGRKVVLFLREDTPMDANHDRGEYDDRAVVLWKDADGAVHVEEFRACTEPSDQFDSVFTGGPIGGYDNDNYGVDVNGDGDYEAGRLDDGTFTFGGKQPWKGHDGKDMYRIQGPIRMQEDANDDLVFDSSDPTVTQTDNDTVLIHPGRSEENPASAGCISIPPGEWSRFTEAMSGQDAYTTVLVNERRLNPQAGGDFV